MSEGTLWLLLAGAILFFAIIALLLRARRPRPATLLVCGATGVGKSTLINAVAGNPLAQTGIGAPVTQNTTRIEAPELGLAFYDSRGMEVLEASQTYLLLMSDLLHLRYTTRIRDQIDLVLMCIQEPQGRIDDAHREIAALCEDLRIPFAVIITKAEGRTELLAEAVEAFPTARFVLPVRALDLCLASITIPAQNVDILTQKLLQHCLWDASEARARAQTAMKTSMLSRAARELASSRGDDGSAWVKFAQASFSLLDRQQRGWIIVKSDMASALRQTMVSGFFRRVFLTRFDNARIDAAIARNIVPFVVRRFGDGSRRLLSDDIAKASAKALQSLERNLPFRSRF